MGAGQRLGEESSLEAAGALEAVHETAPGDVEDEIHLEVENLEDD